MSPGLVLVTGAGSGIGRATCELLLAAGDSVAALDRDTGALAGLAAEHDDGRLTTVVVDVTDPEAVESGVAEAAERLGGLTGVVTSAGGGAFSGDIARTTLEHWRFTLDLNVTGTFLVCRAALPALRATGGGSFVTISSTYGMTGLAEDPSYATAKAAVIGLTRAMAIDHGPEGIRANCIAPGTITTPHMVASRLGTATGGPGGREGTRVAGRMVLGGPGQPSQVAAGVAFLLSAAASNITGVVLPIDGGWMAG
ncbi:SDR family NAD(P)-dependent oxidoreductase [soil metagenome]